MTEERQFVNLTKVLEADEKIQTYERLIYQTLVRFTKLRPKTGHGLLVVLGDYYGADLEEFAYRTRSNSMEQMPPVYVTDRDFFEFMKTMVEPERDGALIVDRGAGQLAAADVLAETDINAEVETGLGMRHKTALHISRSRRNIGTFVLNEDWSMVRVYKKGKLEYFTTGAEREEGEA